MRRFLQLFAFAFTCWIGLSCVGGAPAFAEDIPPTPDCIMKDANLPADFVVFAGGGPIGRPLDFTIDSSSGEPAGQMDVTVNYPDKPVALILGNYWPTIWNVKWTKGTKIIAVYATGYYRQALAGLEDGTPVLTTTDEQHKNPTETSACFLKAVGGRDMANLNMASYAVFNRAPDKVVQTGAPLHNSGVDFANGMFPKGFTIERRFPDSSVQLKEAEETPKDPTKILFGAPISADTPLLTSEKTAPETFRDKNAPLVGLAGFEDAAAKGILRKATMEDADEFIKSYVAHSPAPNTDIPPVKDVPFMGEHPQWGMRLPRISGLPDAYVVLKDFAIPARHRGETTTLFVAKGSPMPTGNFRGAWIYDLNTGKCKPDYNCPEPPRPHTPSETALPQGGPECAFDPSKLPLDFDIVASGVTGGRVLKFIMDSSGEPASQVDVKVNQPGKPVALMLVGYNPVVWNVSVTKGTKVAAVLLGGYYKQVVAGLDESTPIIVRTRENLSAENDRHCDYISPISGSDEDLEIINPLSRKFFGKAASIVVPMDDKGVVRVGDDAPEASYAAPSKKVTAETFRTGSAAPARSSSPTDTLASSLPADPLAEAVAKGIIRHATEEDYRAWAAAWLVKHPDPQGSGEIPPTINIHRKGAVVAVPPFFLMSGYVVLKPYDIPKDVRAHFIVPKGVPSPSSGQFAGNGDVIYTMEDADCTPRIICLYDLADK